MQITEIISNELSTNTELSPTTIRQTWEALLTSKFRSKQIIGLIQAPRRNPVWSLLLLEDPTLELDMKRAIGRAQIMP